ncbi:MAG: tetratricopeptide repeat protein [Hyphomicrobiaceae bacterium]
MAGGLLTLCGPALAQSGAWDSRVEAPAAPAEPGPKLKSKNLAKPQSGPAPQTSKSAPRATVGDTRPTPLTQGPQRQGFQLAPATGDDAALIAFNQGQFLTALGLAEVAAGRGDAAAHTLVGRIYAEGLGVRKDPFVAVRWFSRAAELGDAEAAFIYGSLLAEGTGVEKDIQAAAQMFETAARTGHVLANYNLGLMFLTGRGKPENMIRGAQHIAYAAEQGIPAAQYDLAGLYIEGQGVRNDAYEAARWMRRAADQGMAEAEFDYAVMLLRGHGLNVDVPKAIDYLKSAADKGVAGAQNRIAYVFFDLERYDRDPIEAAKWRILAREAGIEDKTLDKAVAGLTAAERATAESRARAYRERRSLEGR